MISFNCPACGKKLSVPDQYGDKKARCPGCQKTIIIPQVVQPEDIPVASVKEDMDTLDPPQPTYIPPREQPHVHSSEGNNVTSVSLIQCPDCGNAVSARAETCPKCGCPIAGGGSTQAHEPQQLYPPPPHQPQVVYVQQPPPHVQTIEKTSKSWKGALVLGCLAWLVFLIVLLAGASVGDSGTTLVGIIGIAACALWTGIVKVMIWWHHG
jgi:predicted RNA-binding Zn-ribbon protein involved in translation (DUF1610 family)